MNNAPSGFQNSQEYLISGLPYVANTTGSLHVEFPTITRSLSIAASGTNAYVYFSGSAGSATKFLILANTSQDLPLRIRDLWIESSGSGGTVSMCAAMTTISRNCMCDLDSTKWSGV
jgi:hypothetical protein